MEEHESVHIDTRISPRGADAASGALKDECARLHNQARTMDASDERLTRGDANELDELAEHIKEQRRDVISMRVDGALTDQRKASGSSSIIQIDNTKLLPWLMVLALLSGLAIGLCLLAMVLSQQAERETKLAREDLRVMAIALAAHGVNTDEHAIEKGSKP